MSNSNDDTAKKSTAYNPVEVETRLYNDWLKSSLFSGDSSSSKETYSIVIPPPNVTAVLHLGHALNNTIQDILVRKHRMSGFETEWLPGSDHAGIATQVIVEKELVKEGTTRREIGRDKFVERTWQWATQNKDLILNQLKRLGCSCDWDRTRFTLDEGLSEAVVEVFRHLYEKGLIYRGHRIVNWCISCKTSISDDEVNHKDFESHLWYIKYKLQGSDEYLTVATTRPETMLGDTALAVSPKDSRFKKYIGKTVILPILEREIPIVADSYVDPEFGTGVVKVTPAHDPNDFEIGKRHDLEEVNILNIDGTINENGGKFKGMERYEARKALVEELKKKGQLEKIEDYQLSAGTCYRCNTVVEPYLSDQWFVKMSELAQPAIDAVKSGKLRFHPDYWSKTYLHWMENIRDWCISRQLWWGHRVPIWYAEDGSMFVSADRPTAKQCEGYDPETLVQDEDVLDTWFSSWLWPFSTFGWPEKTDDLQKFYPTRVLVTASEIIFLWVARMVMSGYEFMGECPFTDVYIHGTVKDANGVKMSKSLGNGIDPVEIIDKHGADALRLSLLLATPDGQDPCVGRNTFEIGRNFVNKLYQVSRFVRMRIGEEKPNLQSVDKAGLVIFDRWILSRLERTKTQVNLAFSEYRLNAAAKTLYSFVWEDYCSWYVELIKPDVPGENIRPGSLRVATYVLGQIVTMLHPYVPFVTEEIYQDLMDDSGSEATLTKGPWPTTDSSWTDEDLEESLRQIQEVVTAVRSIRAELNVPPGKKSDLYIRVNTEQFGQLLEKHYQYFRSLIKIETLYCGVDVKKPATSASAVISGAEIFLPLAGLIDVEVEKGRLQKNLDSLRTQLEKVSKKLANSDFLANAPDDVIEREKGKKEDYCERISRLNRNLEQILDW
ncbi:MAG: valine--tRNA ligase [candidate division Zixibacteria bacterium]